MKRLLPVVLAVLLTGASPPPRPGPNVEAVPGEARPAPTARTLSGAEKGFFTPEADWASLGAVLVQDAGRRKPLEAFAREKLWRILGSQTHEGQSPVCTLFSMCFDPLWDRARVLKAGHPELVRRLGADPERKRVSLEDLGSEAFERLMAQAEGRMKEERTALDRAVLDLADRGLTLRDLPGHLRVLPSGDGPWLAMGESPPGRTVAPAAYILANNAFAAMAGAWLHQDRDGFSAAAREWASACGEAAAAERAELGGRISLERNYYRFQPFRWALGLYFLALLFHLGAWAASRPGLKRAGTWLMIGAFVLHGGGIAARVALAGRPPVSNMYEVILYVSWAVAASSFAAEAILKLGVTAAPACAMACIGLVAPAVFPFLEGVMGQPLPLDPHIGQVQAVLNNSYWLTVHVCTIATSYAILFLGFATGMAYLLTKNEAADQASYRVSQLGFLFLTAGVLTGAWWANASWGRYWGWDPKETGAFITWCVYAAYLHLRRFGFLAARGSAWMTGLGFLAILYTLIVPSYFLKGLHGYA